MKAFKLASVNPSQFRKSIVVNPGRRFASAVQYKSPLAQDSNLSGWSFAQLSASSTSPLSVTSDSRKSMLVKSAC